MSDFGARLRTRRQERQLTQAELAKRLGVDEKTVRRWERGTSRPSFDLVEPLSKTLGVRASYWTKSERIDNPKETS